MANFTDGNTRVCGLIGNPVKHTLSPLIHNILSEITGINMVYVPFEVETSAVGDAIKGALALDIKGLNVTIPHKSEVIPFLEDIDPLAKGIGAVNTLVRTENGGFKGYNTDMTGLYRAMQDEGVELSGQTVVILGAGGVARPAAFLCGSKGARKVYILNRTFDRAKDVAGEVNRALFELGREDKLTEDGVNAAGEAADVPEIVIPMRLEDYKNLFEEKEKFVALQCTSVGLFPDVNSAVIEDSEFYDHVSVALDMVYRPIDTKFMKLARQAGAKAYSGLKMLLYQAIDAYELWFKEELSDEEGNLFKITKDQADDVYRSLVLEVTGARNIVLEGFMGSGKTTVSEILSDKLELELFDTDAAIVDTQRRSINEIFDMDGEGAFRDMETALLATAVSDHFRDMVFSLGGGMVMRQDNRDLLKELGKVVYLRAKPETIYERVKDDDSRPLLKGEDPLGKIKDLLAVRGEVYESCADIIIDTDDMTPEEIADRIIEELGITF